MNKKVQIALTILALPLIFCVYFLDRVITILFPLAEVHPIQSWLFNAKAMQYSLIRVAVIGLIYGLYLIFSSLF